MEHNLVGHGYGIMRETRVTARTPGMVTGKTAQSANLGPLPYELNARDTERGIKSIKSTVPVGRVVHPDDLSWDATPAQRVESEIAFFGHENERPVAPVKKRRGTSTRTMSENERNTKFDADVRTWYDRARNQINPVRFILTEVPERYRAAVVQLAA
ncbi:hypothetical protein GTE7_gp091 [Gordonia phage GTE7]|uniref:Uncharacterized protein n=1 Tax=Gordonia phage GTE7 TaxID=1100814 RepID=G8FS84_9CAUD|nr:hypothetical protein GTE7_gp091 [Gordonia phage GTE7]AER26634.1 hypothetical protein [Gordonia phage GTE7]